MNKHIAIIFAILAIACSRLEAQPAVEWIRFYDEGRFEALYDVYAVSDGSYAMCGMQSDRLVSPDTTEDTWVMRTDAEGNRIWSQNFGLPGIEDVGWSIIETDNGDFIVGGYSRRDGFTALRISPEGELRWRHSYGSGYCDAVIELKDNDLLLAGRAGGWPTRALVVCVSGNGDENWSQTYGVGQDGLNEFHGMRETDGGVICAGQGYEVDPGRSSFWAVKIDLGHQGEPIWSHYYSMDVWGKCTGLASVGDGGFLLAGTVSGRLPNQPEDDFAAVRINSNGGTEWARRYNWGEAEGAEQCNNVARLEHGDFALVGTQWPGTRYRPAAIRIAPNGDMLWQELYEFRPEDGFSGYHGFCSVVNGHDNSMLAVGFATQPNQGGMNGMMMKLQHEIYEPQFISWTPRDTVLDVLQGDTVLFRVIVEVRGGHTPTFHWIRNEVDTLAFGDTANVELTFPGLRQETLLCEVTDGEFWANITWHITIKDLFIATHTPDTLSLALRRGSTVNFSIDSVAVTQGDAVNYAWTLRDLGNGQQEDAGGDAHATIQFRRSGNYMLEGYVFRGESSDAVTWNIAVRSTVLDFRPEQQTMSVPLDTTVNFEVIPFDPADATLRYLWLVDGDSVGADSSDSVLFTEEAGGQAGRLPYAVEAIVSDSSDADTIVWNVSVRPNSVASNSFQLSTFNFQLSPNPFNSRSTIHFSLPITSPAHLTLHDLTGRTVRTLANGRFAAGEHLLALNGAELPAGLYFLRLEATGKVKIAKAVVIK